MNGLFHVSPGLASGDSADVLVCHPEVGSDGDHGFATAVAPPDFADNLRIQSRAPVNNSARLATLTDLVSDVVGVGTFKQVIPSDAGWVVASVEAEQAWPVPVVNKESHAMCTCAATASRRHRDAAYLPIPLRGAVSGPDVAGTELWSVARNGATLVNASEETRHKFRGNGTGRQAVSRIGGTRVNVGSVHELTPRGPAPRTFAASRGALVVRENIAPAQPNGIVQVAVGLGGGHNGRREGESLSRPSGPVVVGSGTAGVSTFCARFSLCGVSRTCRVRRSQTNYWERLAAPSGSELFRVCGAGDSQ